MRQFGLDFRYRRPGWRRWGWRRGRRRDLCDLLMEFYPGFTFPECGAVRGVAGDFGFGVRRIPFTPGKQPRFPEPAFSLVGPGCPGVLTRKGYVQQDGLAIVQFSQAGATIPTAEDPISFWSSEEFIYQLRFNPGDGMGARFCAHGLSAAEGQELSEFLNGLSESELSLAGFT